MTKIRKAVGGSPLRRHLARMSVAVLAVSLIAPLAGTADAADGGSGPRHSRDFWKSASGKPAATHKGHAASIHPDRFRAFTLDRNSLKGELAKAPLEQTAAAAAKPQELQLPTPSGDFATFSVVESPVMEADLAAKHPEIKTYAGESVDNPGQSIRLDVTPLGFHASVRGPQGAWYIDPYYQGDDSLYIAYNRSDLKENPHGALLPSEEDEDDAAQGALRESADLGPTVQLRTYRLALVSDPTYATYFGAANVTAAKVTLMNRVDHIYETESGIRLVLINDNDKLNLNTVEQMTGENGPCGAAACYTAAQVASCASSTLSRNRIVIGQIIGAAKYDIGHIIFGLSGGGVASLGVIGGNNKAQGCTGLPTPVGDYFAIDYVTHEMGHQFGGNHSFNGTQKNCSTGNRNANTSIEPGSGSSIMAYAGICDQDNLQPHSDPYWSTISYNEINTYVTSTRAAISAVQTISLRNFGGTNSFRMVYNGYASAPIVRGGNYTAAGIKAAIEASSGWPAGATATVAAFGGSGTFGDTGFQVTFGGTLASTKVDLLDLADFQGGASGWVGETAVGGAIKNQGYIITDSGNHAPVVTAPASYTIPLRTPFVLTGSATDPDGDPVTYMWEQNDKGGAGTSGGTALVSNVKKNGPLFRMFGKAAVVNATDALLTPSPGQNHVDGNPTRVFPDMDQILADNTNAATGVCPAAPLPATTPLTQDLVDCYSEFLPTADYVGPMHFRLTARDGRVGGGGIGSADTTVNLAPGSGPFRVTSVGASGVITGATMQTVKWDVAGTDVAPVNTSDVKITMSVDGGQTFPYTLAASTPNNGSATVKIPNKATSNARIKIEAIGNIFFDVSHTEVTIDPSPEVVIIADVLPGSLVLQAGTQQVTMPAAQLNGYDQIVTGALNNLTVMDGRGTGAGWSVTGQVSDFVGPNGVIVADNLGWQPTGSVISGTLPVPVPDAAVVVPGAVATPGAGTGLRDARTLCGSPAGNTAGAATCGGGLSLGVPGSTRAGTYTGVLTLTLV